MNKKAKAFTAFLSLLFSLTVPMSPSAAFCQSNGVSSINKSMGTGKTAAPETSLEETSPIETARDAFKSRMYFVQNHETNE